MKISGKRDFQANLESVVMTDIVLNMFIFFFISFSLLYTFNPLRIKKLEINLPAASSAQEIPDTEQIGITITNEGLLYWNEKLVTRKDIKKEAASMLKANPDLAVILYSDKLVRFREVVGVFDTLAELGVRNLNIAATTE